MVSEANLALACLFACYSRVISWPPPPTPPPPPPSHTHTHTQMESLLAGCLRWIKDNDHKSELCHFLCTKPALSRSPAINGIWTERFWSTLTASLNIYKKCYWMPPYLTVSYTNLSTEAHLPTPPHGQYITHALIIPAVAAIDSCLIDALEKKKQKTNCIKDHLQMFMLVDSCYFNIRCLRRL